MFVGKLEFKKVDSARCARAVDSKPPVVLKYTISTASIAAAIMIPVKSHVLSDCSYDHAYSCSFEAVESDVLSDIDYVDRFSDFFKVISHRG